MWPPIAKRLSRGLDGYYCNTEEALRQVESLRGGIVIIAQKCRYRAHSLLHGERRALTGDSTCGAFAKSFTLLAREYGLRFRAVAVRLWFVVHARDSGARVFVFSRFGKKKGW